MTTSTPHSHIVVGVDGSTSALHALTWAGAEAQRRNLPLTLVHVIDHSGLAQGYNLGASASFFQHLETDGAEFLSQAKDHVYALHPNVEVSTVKATGKPVPVLVELSRNALMTVLGSSGLSGFTGMMAGSVSVSLTAKGHGPVVVVRESPIPAGGPVVVGVADSESADSAIAWAFEEAAMRDAELVAVRVWNNIPPGYVYAYTAWTAMDSTGEQQRQEEILADQLADWQGKYPEVPVRRVVAIGHPADVLLKHAAGAQLIVTGSRGRGDIAGFFLGSTSHALIHKATCPVLVAPRT
ncbi:universal stress protein [Mycobacteroides immunogenum]|uniref:Universal stress protein n=1 Tax=Mycobacteroides immunogenum TaxID=83262 RepID=A0A7V8LM96_9MYCO|nr:universal stress protein [Mycobacteroides immunogenum]AMT71130.1 universal stress protein [Mycobacteroides immunogenum]ANO04236.1 universal stress protein [Mycobacteroides immunogenum]KIU38095.1 universal stress protein [Mycobacteroides immunogenum]KPG05020.1 universal stress protein [Mycobacteroides immunogenum]KPG06726.1 universal stress protein [Mycobacteroides immunogenum]